MEGLARRIRLGFERRLLFRANKQRRCRHRTKQDGWDPPPAPLRSACFLYVCLVESPASWATAGHVVPSCKVGGVRLAEAKTTASPPRPTK